MVGRGAVSDARENVLTIDAPAIPPATLPKGFQPGGDEPVCSQCGTIMQRAGSCFVCPDCGNNSGCS